MIHPIVLEPQNPSFGNASRDVNNTRAMIRSFHYHGSCSSIGEARGPSGGSKKPVEPFKKMGELLV